MCRSFAIAIVLACAACTPDAPAPSASRTPSVSAAGPAAPSASATTPPSASAPSAPSNDDARVRERFGGRCRLERRCGALLGVDCEAAVDGPYYYVKADSLAIVSTCGGACMGGRCTNCPPKEWTCATY